MKGRHVFRRLTFDEVRAWLARRPDALLLDARDAASYARDGWPGAVRLSADNQDALLLRTDRQRPVLIYCYKGNASQVCAQMFADFGFTDVCDLVGGHRAWTAGVDGSNPSSEALAPELAAWLAREGFIGTQARGAHGNTPLMNAAWRGAPAVVEQLLACGVALDAINEDGNNALWFACVNGNPSLVTRLVAAGVPMDHANANGATCLMLAASSGKAEVLSALLALGADPALRSEDGFTAADMAASVDCLQLLRQLREA
ncbi:ankyrin repeat family protein [Paraburkholderia xenovorans LB400]|uniref:Ankyrin repeat protein n=1 Tax=Paraburkholderia xenovorans (strain LB400) TaxID=266265 RepID=Q13N36_PARXL|nr:ankyrin repeat domain-containing protein [Paraburkholderia xenovorans]ABE34503.1 Putative ankyrin repeat protein [Paraburkholderia xenovorans LB400]AIP36184.1 ankyrin repeat family protein [Paraburkholderia xenovorans LB400]